MEREIEYKCIHFCMASASFTCLREEINKIQVSLRHASRLGHLSEKYLEGDFELSQKASGLLQENVRKTGFSGKTSIKWLGGFNGKRRKALMSANLFRRFVKKACFSH